MSSEYSNPSYGISLGLARRVRRSSKVLPAKLGSGSLTPPAIMLFATRRLLPLYSTSRSFSTSSTLLQRTSLESPSYAGLFYHPAPSSPTAWSLSFLPSPAPYPAFAPTTIGVLDHNARDRALGKAGEGIPELSPRNFVENGQFKEVLHDILRGAVGQDLVLDTVAKTRPEDGYMQVLSALLSVDSLLTPLRALYHPAHTSNRLAPPLISHIADARCPLDPNRVPDPSDIIASLLVQGGKVIAESYEAGAMHRLVTADGMMKLDESLMKELRKGLEKVRQVEEEVAREANAEEERSS